MSKPRWDHPDRWPPCRKCGARFDGTVSRFTICHECFRSPIWGSLLEANAWWEGVFSRRETAKRRYAELFSRFAISSKPCPLSEDEQEELEALDWVVRAWEAEERDR